MNKNRRNYYRILQSQPDASQEVIKNNYRTLLQKLKIHPDLGGEERTASLINEAYHTLRNPGKRAAYDQELLRQYQIATLSRGQFNRLPANSRRHIGHTREDRQINERNYYRLLNVQPDSPPAIISASYRTLLHRPNAQRELLRDAYRTLINRDSRTLYDQLLINHTHTEIITLHNGKSKTNPHSGIAQLVLRQTRPKTSNSGLNNFPVRTGRSYSKSSYQPLIKHYCAFCKSPSVYTPCTFSTQFCHDCGSPLNAPHPGLVQQPRRILERMLKTGSVQIYDRWPGNSMSAEISDLSPTGMRISTRSHLEQGQFIKIDGTDFKAVGEITHRHMAGDTITAGIRFITVYFSKHKGQFLAATV